MSEESLLSAGAETTEAAPATNGEGQAEAGDSLLSAGADAAQRSTQDEGSAQNEEAGEAAPEGAPEAYADFKTPEGQELIPEVATEVQALAKELNLPQDKAQLVFDTAAKLAAAGEAAQAAKISAIHNDWREQTRGDKEIGGDKLAENLAVANAAMKATATPELMTLLDKSGLGNHPEVIRHFLRIAPAFSQDKHVQGGTRPTGSDKSTAQVLYGNTSS